MFLLKILLLLSAFYFWVVEHSKATEDIGQQTPEWMFWRYHQCYAPNVITFSLNLMGSFHFKHMFKVVWAEAAEFLQVNTVQI